MAKATPATKKRNPSDATTRNVRAAHTRDQKLDARIDKLEVGLALAFTLIRVLAAAGLPEDQVAEVVAQIEAVG